MFGGVASTVHLRKQLHDMNPRCFRVSVITVPGQEHHHSCNALYVLQLIVTTSKHFSVSQLERTSLSV